MSKANMKNMIYLLFLICLVGCNSLSQKQIDNCAFLERHGNEATILGYKTIPDTPSAVRRVMVKFKDGTEVPVRFGRSIPGVGETWLITLEPGTHDLMLWNLK